MKKTIYFLMIIFLFCSCLTELEFDAGNNEAIVVSGVITNSRDESTIVVSRSQGINAEVSKIKASGAVYKNGELDQELVSINEGELVVPIWYRLEEGASYHVEITTEDGLEFQSTPQILQPILRPDSISFELTRRREGVSRFGAPIYIWLVDVFAHIEIPPESEGRYYKWHVDEAWSFVSQFATCYLRREEIENPITVVSSKELGMGSYPIRIASVRLDDSFFHKHYFNAYLHSIDEASFDFYRKVDRLTTNTGNLYDDLPAPVRGNVFMKGEATQTVLGNIEFSLVDTMRLPIEREDISIQLFNVCESPSPCPPDPPPPEPAAPCACRNCGQFFGFRTLVKPFYWED